MSSIKTHFENGQHTIQFQHGKYALTLVKQDGDKNKWEVIKDEINNNEDQTEDIVPRPGSQINSNQWDEAGSFIKSLFNPGQVVKYLSAETSKLIHGPATLPVINFRHSCCYGVTIEGESVRERCVSLYTDPETGHDYCKLCGCGKWKKARLNPQTPDDWTTSKLAYPVLACPRGRF